MDSYSIRDGRLSDHSSIFELLQESVEEENMRDQFTNTEHAFREDMSAEKKLFGSIVVEHHFSEDEDENHHSSLVGCCLYSHMYDYVIGRTLLLHGLYIKPTHKDKRLKEALVKATKKIAVNIGINVILILVKGDNIVSKALFQKLGAFNLTKSLDYCIEVFVMTLTNRSTKCLDSESLYSIREGKSSDCSATFQLLKKLAECGNIGDDFINTEEAFTEDESSENECFGSLLVEYRPPEVHGNQVKPDIVGCILYSDMHYFLMGRTFFIQGLYILPNHRGKGLSKALVEATAGVASERGIRNFVMMIIADNAVSKSLFQGLGAVNTSQSEHNMEWMGIRLNNTDD